MRQVTDTKPWYKYPWLWLLIMIPAVSVTLSFTMLWVAINNKDPEVEGDWHKNRKAIEQDFSRNNYASALTISASLSITGQQLTLRVDSPYDLDKDARTDTLNVTLSHPTNQAKDITLTLKKAPDGTYTTPFDSSLSGRYYIAIGNSVWQLSDMVILPLESTPYIVKPIPLSS